MSKSIITHTVHSIIVGQRKEDGYLNITALAKAYENATGKRKDVANWLLTERANEYIAYLSRSTGQPVDLLIRKVMKGKNENRGTWVHPDLAIPFATWLSVEFEFLVSKLIRQWIETGVVTAQWQQVRIEGKATRRSLTDAIADYIQRHTDELSENEKRWLFTNTSQQVDLIVFGRIAKKLAEDLEVPRENLRDSFTSDELQLVREVENTAMRIIDRDDIHPLEAVRQMGTRLAIPVQMRGLKRKLEG